MATAKPKSFYIDLNDLIFLQEQVSFPTIKVVGYQADGTPIYGYEMGGTFYSISASLPPVHLFDGTYSLASGTYGDGSVSSFNPLVPSADGTNPIYFSARDYHGLRNVSGAFNNLVDTQQEWGQVNHEFLRLTKADYSHYVAQDPTNPAYVAAANHDYSNPTANVVDYTPRMISETVVRSDGDVFLSLTTDNASFVDQNGHVQTEHFIRNQNTVGGDPSFSGWFVLFGQFFDHGLDFISKPAGNATITVPLSPDDPLYGAIGPDGHPTYSMTITRATALAPGANGPNYENYDSPYIDQSQTYGSDVQVTQLLRTWVQDPNHPGQWIPGAGLFDGHSLVTSAEAIANTSLKVSSWHLADGTETDQTLPTLNELRAYLLATGRDDLSWEDIGNYRIRDAHGHVVDFDPNTAGVQSIGIDEALILDMNPHFDAGHINLSRLQLIDGGISGIDFLGPYNLTVHYSDGRGDVSLYHFFDPAKNDIQAGLTGVDRAVAGEMLLESIGDHYVAGDGRANENFGLTAIHHVFHEDHNVQLDNLEHTILSLQDLAGRHDWQVAVSNGAGGFFQDAQGNYLVSAGGEISWNQDKLFDATKLIVEMEYQHVAIDQYARFVTPDLPEFVTYDASVRADISLEYAEAAFRFGHSQLRETIDLLQAQGETNGFDLTGAITKVPLFSAFLNPTGFAENGPTAIALGMTRQVGNETDEFVTDALQQGLLGQPLDLATINIARGRDLGLPTLNEARKQIHDAIVAERTANPDTPVHANINVDALNPYVSWFDFANNMIHPESLVNFIAAYSFDGDVTTAQAILDLDAGVALSQAEYDAITALGWHAPGQVALWNADDFLNGVKDGNGNFVIAGAGGFNNIDLWLGGLAERHVYLGQLGPTFNAIFEDQMERLMDGDRFYYLYRLDGALAQITNLSDSITNEQFKDIIERTTDARHLRGDVMTYADSYVELSYHPGTGEDFATSHKYGDLIDQYHVGVYSTGGTTGGIGSNGRLISLANAENGTTQTYIRDYRPDSHTENPDGTPVAGYNAHEVLAGTDYDDYLDSGDGDDDIYGGLGNDIIIGGAGADHCYGEAGNDTIYGGDIDDFMDGGDGDDVIYAGSAAGATDIVIGGAGDDKLYGEAGIDNLYGGTGDDYIDAGGDTDLAYGDAGNDTMYGGDGPDALYGGYGDDLLSGGSGSDVIWGEQGDDILLAGTGGGVNQGDADELQGGDGFDLASFADASVAFDAIADLNNQNLTGTAGTPQFEPFNLLMVDLEGIIGSKFSDSWKGGAGMIGDANDNWLIGAGGDDIMQGGAGNDVVVGGSIDLETLDAFLATQGFATHMNDLRASLLAHGRTFMLGDSMGGGNDTAILSGNRAEYTLQDVSFDAGGIHHTAYKVTQTGAGTDGTDLYIDVDWLKFADVTIGFNDRPATGGVHISSYASNGALTATNNIVDPDIAHPVVSYQWQYSTNGGTSWTDVSALAGGGNANYNPTGLLGIGAHTGQLLQVVGTYTDPFGSHSFVSDETAIVGTNGLFGLGGNDTLAGTAGANYVIGLGGADSLSGADGNDTIDGGAGNDTLNGGTGADSMLGGDGNDTYVVDDNADVIVDTGGTDTVQTTLGAYALGTGLENLTYTGSGNFAGTGNSAANVITGGLGDDTLNGQDGNDSLSGGNGDDVFLASNNDGRDTMSGGSGLDTYDGSAVTVAQTINLSGNQVITGSGRNAVTDTLNSIENAIGGSGNDTITSGAANTVNVLTGSAGNDVFVFFSGNTALTGVAAGGRDVITDFIQGSDRIDVSAFDANGNSPGNGLFSWGGMYTPGVGPQPTTSSMGRLYAHQEAGHTIVEGTTNGTSGFDFQIDLVGTYTLTANDFIL